MTLKYQVSLPNFEGPLDLLYHLVKKAEVDIYDISISEITDQYLSYLEEWERFNLEIASEFLVMAARLMELKSRELLPKQTNKETEDEEETDPKEELLTKIMEYRYFKEIAYHLKEKEQERFQVYWREQPKIPFQEQEEIPIGNVGMHDLLKAFQNVLKKQALDNKVETIDTNEVSISEQKDVLMKLLKNREKQTMHFQELFEQFPTRLEIIATFIALLDLVKEGKLSVSQQGIKSPLWIELS